MNIALVGGGKKSRFLINLIERHSFIEMNPRVVAVADVRDDAPAVVLAKSKGLIVTKDYRDFLEREDIDLIIEMTGSEEIYREVLKKKKRHVQVIDDSAAQLFWEIGRVTSMHEQTKQELEKTRTMYDAAINAFYQEDVMVIGSRYDILDINGTMLRNLGLKREEVVGRNCYEISHNRDTPCDGMRHPCPLRECLETRQPSQTTHIHRDKDDKKVYYSISCYPIFENGEVVGGVEISKDITKDINFQKGLIRQQKLASIGHLAAGVAHEINNPLTTILTTAMLIQEDLDPEDPNYEELETITNETLRCRKIVTGLLDFARQAKPTKNEYNINEIVEQSIALTRKQGAFKDIVLEGHLSEGLPLIYVDKDQIQQSIINLALNAIEATEAGGRVTLSTRFISESEMIEIGVRDTGKGISSKNLDKVFDPFFTTKESGTGLGLAITHGLIEQHGGTIHVESTPGKGTVFMIRLPVKKGGNDAF